MFEGERERAREKGKYVQERKKCVHVRACVINLINFAAALSHSHFYGSGEQPLTSETKGNVESSSKDR